MKSNFLQTIWMVFLFGLLIGLLVWAIFYVDPLQSKISIFGIVAVILAAFTSVLTVTINNRKAKEREYDLLVLKEKQKVYEHFYNALFEGFSQTRKGKGLSQKAVTEMMNFKRGLMNWGSERLIQKYMEYDTKLIEGRETFDLIRDGDKFLKEIRREMGFEVSNKINLMSIILTAEARKELDEKGML
ncbi:MAG: hypothetical protein RLN90_01265 [Balneolaceae bacterium]